VNGKTQSSEKRSRVDAPVNRKLIRPSMAEIKDKLPGKHAWRKSAPPESTSAESFYYLKQMNARTPMVLVMKDGEVLHGVIEWYDRLCLKVNRQDGPNLLVMKDSLKYLYKQNDGNGR
jgi:sRNA-binding regulator protein Hfq